MHTHHTACQLYRYRHVLRRHYLISTLWIILLGLIRIRTIYRLFLRHQLQTQHGLLRPSTISCLG